MKAKLLSVAFTILSMQLAFGQLSTIPPTVMCNYRPSGWIFFNSGTASVGDLFTLHKSCFFTEPEDSMVLIREWTDNFLNYDHYRYQQMYLGIEVEGCEFIEHSDQNGKLVYANGKICSKIHTRYNPKVITEEVAMSNLLAHYEGHTFSWEVPEWEISYKIDMEDSSATTFPTGELVFALENYTNIQYDMDPNDYRLAWRFDVLCIDPDFHYEIYVDAVTGVVFKEYNMRHYDGPANILGHGIQTIDTRERGFPNNDFVLETDNGVRNIHTKIDGGSPWASTAEVDDNDDDWGTSNQLATTPHWMVTQAWVYYTTVWGREGMHNNNVVRVRADENAVYGALFDPVLGFDRILVGHFDGVSCTDCIYSADLAVMAHEFTHGVDHHEGKLKYEYESGALDESFADIFGFLARRWVTGVIDWEIGPTGALSRDRRDMQFPNSLGFHLEYDGTFINEFAGQPDTYGGDFFYDLVFGNDAGGVHVNSGVMNHWFYMLSMGEVGVNDLGSPYTVNGIGIDKAAEITYYNFTNNMSKNSQYEDAMEGAIAAALFYYGECSFEHIETQNAWYAAGLGTWSSCEGASIEELEMDFIVYPNPASHNIMVRFNETDEKNISIYSSNGQLLRTFENVTGEIYVIDVSNLSSGTYLIHVSGSSSAWKKFVKK